MVFVVLLPLSQLSLSSINFQHYWALVLCEEVGTSSMASSGLVSI